MGPILVHTALERTIVLEYEVRQVRSRACHGEVRADRKAHAEARRSDEVAPPRSSRRGAPTGGMAARPTTLKYVSTTGGIPWSPPGQAS